MNPLSATEKKNIKELKDFAKTHRQKNRELNQELSHRDEGISSLKHKLSEHEKWKWNLLNQELSHRDEGISSLKHKLSEHEKWNLLLPSPLKKYKIDDILNLAEKLKIKPDKLLELAYTPSDVITILELKKSDDKITTRQVTTLMEDYKLFQNPYAKRLYRLADSDRTEKVTSTVFLSILGVIEFYYWYERGKTLQKGLKLIWKEHKEDFIYLSKR